MRVMVKQSRKIEAPAAKKAGAGFDYPTSSVGTGKWLGADGKPVTVLYDPATGATGLTTALCVLKRIDDLMQYLDEVFGVRGFSGNVIIAPDFGGAYHADCNFNALGSGSDWYESESGPDTTFGLVMAEACESYMGLQNKGWNCGGSGGEGLSRFLAEVATGGASGGMAAYSAGPSWDGTNWIASDQGTDGDYPSIGCSVLYFWWIISLGFSVKEIIQAGAPDGTLASNYALLTAKPATEAFANFKSAVAAPVGTGSITSDNPWNAATPPFPLDVPTPTPPPTPTPTPTPTPPAGLTLVEAVLAVRSGINLVRPWYDLLTAEQAESAAIAGLTAAWPAGFRIQSHAFPFPIVQQIVEWLLKTLGVPALPMIEAWVNSLTWLTLAQKVAIDAAIASFLGSLMN